MSSPIIQLKNDLVAFEAARLGELDEQQMLRTFSEVELDSAIDAGVREFDAELIVATVSEVAFFNKRLS